MTATRTEQTIVERIVRGRKDFIYVHPETGDRSRAKPGTRVKVRIGTARNHKDVLQDPAVVKAQLVALEEEQAALAKDEAAREATKRGEDKKPTGSTDPSQTGQQGQSQGSQGKQASK